MGDRSSRAYGRFDEIASGIDGKAVLCPDPQCQVPFGQDLQTVDRKTG